MNINHHNYEEFFILYVDNELSPKDRSNVEAFIQKNPDLKEDLVILLQSKLMADNSIVFENKEDLKKITLSSNISMTNLDEWLVAYLDNELTEKDISALEEFIKQHPEAKKELDIYKKVKLQPETAIVFPGKESLYRKEEKTPIIPANWWRIAAAAVLILAAGLTAIVLVNKQPVSSIRGNEPITQKNNNAANKNPVNEHAKDVNKKIPESPVVTEKNLINEPDNKQTVKNKLLQIEKKNIPAPVNKEDKNLAAKNQNPSNNLSVPEINANRPDNLKDVTNVIKNEKTLIPQNKPDLPVTTQVTDTYITYTSSKPKEVDDVIYASDSGESKNRLRGFFRKVTRVFERTTNINATDDEDRLLIGGLSVKLK